MNFAFFIIAIILVSAFTGTAFGLVVEKDFTEEEIDSMKHKAVLIKTPDATFMIELFPEEAPNTVHNFLNLVENGYYDGIVFHRIIPGFMIQAGDPNTKNPDRSLWGQGGPGYTIASEFNDIQHDKGIVSMARKAHPDSAGSQFFIMHRDTPDLDGKYTVFGRLVPGLPNGLEQIAGLETDNANAPLEPHRATIIEAVVLDPYSSSGFTLDRNKSFVSERKQDSGSINVYESSHYGVMFDLPYRWEIMEESQNILGITLEPGVREHNALQQAERSGFIPKVLVGSEPRTNWELENDEISTAFYSIQGGDEHKILSNIVFENEDRKKAHIVMSTQNVETEEGTQQFKILQIHFNNSEKNYSIVYVNLSEYFRFEVNAFAATVNNFGIVIDGKMQLLNFGDSPVFDQVIRDARAEPEPESLPPARVGGGCLIATASYGSELAPQVQLLREIRDNTVLQTQSGTSFMNGFNQFYYSFSPIIADYERESPIFKEATKLTLTPLLASLALLQYVDINSEHEMLGYGTAVILLNIGMYFVAPAVLIMKIRSFYKLQ